MISYSQISTSAEAPRRVKTRFINLAVSFLILLLIVVLWLDELPGPFGKVTYFETAVSLARDGDLFLVDHLSPPPAGLHFLTTKGHSPRQHPFGRGLVAWPFVWVGCRLAPVISDWFGPMGRYPILDYSPDNRQGGRYLTAWYNLPGLIAAVIAIILLWQINRSVANPLSANLAVTGVLFGTHLHRIVWISQGGAEGVALLFWAAILWLCVKIVKSANFSIERAILLGFCCGMAILIRLQSIIWLIPPCIVWLSLITKPGVNVKRMALSALLFLVFLVMSFAPQLLVWKCWYGRWLLNTYGQLIQREPMVDILVVWLHRLRFFSHTPLVWLSLLGLFLARKRMPVIVLSGFGVIMANLCFSFIERGFIENQNIAARHFIAIVPFYILGLTEIVRDLSSRRKIWFLPVFIIIVSFSFLQVSAFNGPDYFREEGYSLRDLLLWNEYLQDFPPLINLPRSPMGPIIGLILLPIILLASWGVWFCHNITGERRLYRITRLQVVGAGCIIIIVILVTMATVARTEKKVAELQADGFFRDCWRTMAFNWGIFVDDTRVRALSYIKAGKINDAERFFELSMLIHPGRYWPDLPERMRLYRENNNISGHVWQGLCDHRRLPGRVIGVEGIRLDNPSAVTDGDLTTIARVGTFTSSPPSVTIMLNREGGPLSDAVVVLENRDIIRNLRVSVSTDEIAWEKPFSSERWIDTLWIWDLHQRPWRYIRIEGFKLPEEASIREVFTVFSPRHSTWENVNNNQMKDE